MATAAFVYRLKSEAFTENFRLYRQSLGRGVIRTFHSMALELELEGQWPVGTPDGGSKDGVETRPASESGN